MSQRARSRRCAPLSTLAVVLVRATCQIPPAVVLSPIIGGCVAPNMFAALVGDSGAGKGASEAAGRDAIRYNVEDPTLPEFSPGSGEGIARTLMAEPTALFIANEIDTLAALFACKGQTLEPELRKLYMGERLGFANAGKDTRTKVDALSYRAGLIVGVQPLRAGALLNAADGGTPQRFLWAPTRDPDMPTERPAPMDPLDMFPPYWANKDREITVCAAARADIERQHVDYHRGVAGVDPFDRHGLLTRLKVAAGLMVLAGRNEVTEGDWDIAGAIMAVSRATRAGLARAAEEQRHRRVIARAAEAVEREEYIGESKLRRAKRRVLSIIDKGTAGEIVLRGVCSRGVRSDLRTELDPALIELIGEGTIYAVELEQGIGYVRANPATPANPDSPAETGLALGLARPTPPPNPSWENGPESIETPHPGENWTQYGLTPPSKPGRGRGPRPDYGPAAIPVTDESIATAARMAREHNRKTANDKRKDTTA